MCTYMNTNIHTLLGGSGRIFYTHVLVTELCPPRALKEVIKFKLGHNGGALVQQDRCPTRGRDTRDAHAQRKGHARIQ